MHIYVAIQLDYYTHRVWPLGVGVAPKIFARLHACPLLLSAMDPPFSNPGSATAYVHLQGPKDESPNSHTSSRAIAIDHEGGQNMYVTHKLFVGWRRECPWGFPPHPPLP